MGLLDDASKLKYSTVSAPDISDVARLIKSGSTRQIDALRSRTPIIDKVQQERAAQQEGALQALLLDDADETARMETYKEALGAGDLSWADKGRVATSMRDLKQKEATESRAVADQLIQDEEHGIAKEKNDYEIAQRVFEKSIKEQKLAQAKDTFEETQKGYPFAAKKRVRTAEDEVITHEAKIRKEADRNAVNDIVSTSTNALELNRRGQEFLKKGGKDDDGQFKKYANQALATTRSAIDEVSIYHGDRVVDGKKIKGTGIEEGKLSTHTRANYNRLIENEYLRLKEANPLADDALLRKKAVDAIKQTSAQRLFEKQGWYERLTDPALWKVTEQKRVLNVNTESRKLLLDANKAHSASVSDPDKRGDFKEKLLKLNIHARNNPDTIKPGVKNQIASLTEKGIRDVVAIDFNPSIDYKTFIKSLDPNRNIDDFDPYRPDEVDDPESEMYDPFAGAKYNPLGVDDFSPTHRQMFMEQQTEIIQRDFPDASEGMIQQKLADKIQKSPLGVLYVTGGHKAALKATHERFTVENRVKEMKYRADLEGNFIQHGGKDKNIAAGAAKHTFNEVFARINPNLKLTSEETNKLRNQIDTVYTKWNSYFVKDNLNKQQRLSVNIAIHEILQGIELDRDDTSNMFTMWLDETDITVAGIDRFDDAKNIKKNQALTAILAHIDTGKRPAVTQYLQNKILAEVPKEKKAERERIIKQFTDAKSLRMGLKDGQSLLGSIANPKN